MAENNNDAVTTKFKVDISDLKRGIAEANKNIKLANAQFKDASAGMDNWRKSSDGIKAKLSQLQSVLNNQVTKLRSYKDQLKETEKASQENEKRATELKAKLQELADAGVSKTSEEYKKYAKALTEVEKEQAANEKSAESLRTTILNQQGSIDGIAREMRNWKSELTNVEASQRQAESAVGKLTSEISEQQSELDKLKQKYKEVALAEGENSDEANALANRIRTLSSELRTNQQRLSEVEGAADGLDATFQDVGDGARESSDGFTVMKGAIANLISDGLQKLASAAVDTMKTIILETDKAYDNFQAQTGASASEMKKFKSEINAIYKSGLGESIQDVADAMSEVKQQTKETDPSKLKELTENAIALRDTFDMDIKESMRAVNMLMEQFGISGSEAYNLIVQGAQNGLDKNGDLLDTINEYGVHYKQLGYSADEFFNSLKNGTDAGTFSVDKLGDAMKEFGIRTKDTATTTQEGFQLLGYGASASAEEIEKAKDEVSKLEKNLKYAKKEQEGFNSKTSDLTKMKSADKIKEYSKKLSDAKETLKSMTSTTKKTTTSVSDLQEKFAKGGKTAKKATQEVLKKLMSMDDKVKQNQAGVDLFGTMWEDLGIEGVKALMNTNGELTKTKKSMEEMKKVKYDNVASEFTKIGRSLQMNFLMPLAEKAIPTIKSFTNFVIKNLDGIITAAKVVGIALGTAFVINKVSTFTTSIGAMINAFNTLRTATVGATAAQKLLNIAQAASPIGAVITGVGLLAGGFIALSSAIGEAKSASQERNEKATEQLKTVQDEAKAYDDLKQSQTEQAAKDLAGIANVQRLKDELTRLTDATGKVKEKDKERANFILGELNNALGTEYTMTGNQIENYKKMQSEIAKTIQAKKAEILLKSQEGVYTTAVQKYTEAQANSAKISQEIVTQENKVLEAKKNKEMYENAAAKATDDRTKFQYRQSANLYKKTLKTEQDTLDKKKKAYASNESTLKKYYADIETYENASTAVQSGNTKKAIKILENKNTAVKKAADVADKSASEQKKILGQQVIDTEVNAKLMKERYKNGVKGVTKEMVNTAKKQAETAKKEFYNVGGNITKGIGKGAEGEKWTLSKSMSGLISSALKAAKKAAGIKSPSRVFANEVGKWISKGIAVGVTNNKTSVSTAVTGLIKSAVSSAKTTWGSSGFDNVGTSVLNSATKSINAFVKSSTNSVKSSVNSSIENYSDTIDKKIKKINKSVDKQVKSIKADKKLSDAQKTKRINKIKDGAKEEIAELKKNKTAYKEAGKASITAYTDALKDYASTAKEAVSAAMDEVNAAFEEKYNALVQKQESLLNKFKDFGTLYTVNDNGTMTINDITKQTEAINKYASDLKSIKGKVSAELFDEIANMSMEDGQKYVSKLLAMNDKDLKAYNAAYTQKLNAAKSLSEQIYANDLKSLNTQYNAAVDKALGGLSKKLQTIGKNAMSGFISGMKSQKSSMAKDVKTIANDIIKQFKKTLKIHSPSKVFAKEVGQFIPSGIAVGIKDNAKALVKSVKAVTNQAVGLSQNLLAGMAVPELNVSGAGAGNGATTTNVVNNYTQTINAPKQPSRIELYRQTKNLLSLKGGV